MKTIKIGVVIARFQTPRLHRGHTHVLDVAEQNSDILCVLLGDHGGAPTDRDPLDFGIRKSMLLEVFPHAIVLRLNDCISNEAWSQHVDQLVQKQFPEGEITLYGSRDSFIAGYSGTLEIFNVDEVEAPSATDLRNKECLLQRNNEDFRAGIVYNALNRFPLVYMTVDVAVVRRGETGLSILLGRKIGDGELYRLIGGFVDKTDESLESAAKRELLEEVGAIQTNGIQYITSVPISDFRYRLSKDSVLTTLFITEFEGGKPYAMDDLDEVKWFSLESAKASLIHPHRVLAQKVIEYVSSHPLKSKQYENA